MNLTDLFALMTGGENQRVEFKRDDVEPKKLAERMAGMLNSQGGQILLGVEDDGTVSGLSQERANAEEWVMQVARDHLHPAPVPLWEEVPVEDGKRVGIITLLQNAPDKPYKVKHGPSWVTKVRVGTITRDATREEEQRLYQQSGGFRYGLKPLQGARLNDLDHRRLRDYFVRIRKDKSPPAFDSEEGAQLLCNLELAASQFGHTVATVDGMLLFGTNVGRFLPQSGIRAVCYPGKEPTYATGADEVIKGPLVKLCSVSGTTVESGVVDRAVDFVYRNTNVSSHIEGARRVDRRDYPDDAVREIVVNSLVHRDYSIEGTDIMLCIYDDRLEVQSPGRLPNTVTVDGLRSGARYARNQTLVNVMRDYDYVDARGMGIRSKVIPAMAQHNNTEPEFREEEYSFTVTLWK